MKQAQLVWRTFLFALYQRKLSQITTVEVQQIEGVENWGAATEEKFIEDAPAFRVQADQFAVDHRILYFQLGEIFPQALETFVRVSLPRDEFAVAIPDMRQCAEAIVLQLEKEIRVVKWSSDEAELRGVEAGWAHMDMMRQTTPGMNEMESEQLAAQSCTAMQSISPPSEPAM